MSAVKKTETLTFRMDTDTLGLIRSAAKLQRKSLTAFVTDAAYFAAQKELLDQRFLKLDASVFDSVEALLSQPPRDNEDVVKRFQSLPKWAD
jgi:uncharacterized protein (DUF1778 family)